MKPFALTIFTEPIYAEDFIGRAKSFVRPLKYFLQGRELPGKKKFGGHYAVTRSLIEGLNKINADFNYNPSYEKDIRENVIVLAGVERLKKIIRLKNKGKIRRLFAGPNICESPNEEDGILADQAIDVCIVNSQWTREAFIAERNELKERIGIWYAGVATDYWKPQGPARSRDAIVYCKTNDTAFCKEVEDIVRDSSYNVIRIQYGNYNIEEYKDALSRSSFAVFLSKSESQGIALTEAWSMNVPTYVWDPREVIYKNGIAVETTSCPYLTKETGLRWKETAELKNILAQTNENSLSFEPRKQVMDLFSDEQSARNLVNMFVSVN
ncbi:MAG TPA: hypothetical protein VFI06_15895 [Chitinophagaceae bacterium]|nr:hypothetical protein [Chitinophagaceae bacterium]